MIKLIRRYLKDRIWPLCLYIGFLGIFFVVLTLYQIPLEVIRYAFLLAFVWLMFYGTIDGLRYFRRHRQIVMAEQKLEEISDYLPEIWSLLEEDYQDVIRRQQKEHAVMETNARISAQEMRDYYSMWAHQIKTPIAALRLLLQSMEHRENEAEEACNIEELMARQKLIREMKIEIFKIEQYVDMVMTYVRMENMSGDLDFREWQLDDLIKEVLHKYSQMFILQKIRLQYEPVNIRILTDKKWFVFVLEQILSNALKYTKQGSISIYMKGDRLVIQDTGIGIYEEDLPRVFEKGFTGYNGRNHSKSTGIGLYLCKTVLARLKSEIHMESSPGVGTTVYITCLKNGAMIR